MSTATASVAIAPTPTAALTDGIPLGVAMQRYRLGHPTIWKHIDAGEVASCSQPRPGGGGKPMRLVSVSDLDRVTASSNRKHLVKGPPLQDGALVGELVEEYEKKGIKLNDPLIRRWCDWDPHPALGRRVQCVNDWRGRRGLLVSRADVATIVEVINTPLRRRLPGMPGMWDSEGCFQHDDGRMFRTQRYVWENRHDYGFPYNALNNVVYWKKLDHLQVVWSGGNRKGSWWVTVFSDEAIRRLKDWIEGKIGDGGWVKPKTPNRRRGTWRDSEGDWYSTQLTAEVLGCSEAAISSLRLSRAVRFKLVPYGNRAAGKIGGRPVFVHHRVDVSRIAQGESTSIVTPAPVAIDPAPRQQKAKVAAQPDKKIGRPPGRDPEVVERETSMLAAWDRGEFKWKAEAGKAFGFHRSHATKVINAHEREKSRRSSEPAF
jgi:hypothetical protein